MNNHPTWAEIDLNRLCRNYHTIRAHLHPGGKLLGVVKANAYGHGLIPIGKTLEALGIDYLGVSYLPEGVALRQAGISTPILVMGGWLEEQVDDYINYQLDITVPSVYKAELVNQVALRRGVKVSVHIKIDTGMGRLGQQWHTADRLWQALTQLRHLEIKGIWTHLATAEEKDLTYAFIQADRFAGILHSAYAAGIRPALIHMSNSGAFLQMGQEAQYDMVRVGILLYGYPPSPHLKSLIHLEPVMTVKSRVVYVKKPPAGTKVGYGAHWESPGGRWIATLPIGYGDGYPRRAGNKGWVILRGRKCPVVGRVSMDQITVDAGEEAYLGDVAVIFGDDPLGKVDLWELCEAIDAIPYEILCSLTPRVERHYREPQSQFLNHPFKMTSAIPSTNAV